MGAPRVRSRPPWLLLALILCAFAVGAAASLVVSHTAAPAAPTGPVSQLLVSSNAVAVFVVLLFVGIVASIVYQRTQGAWGLPPGFALGACLFILALVGLVVLLHLAWPDGWSGGAPLTPPPTGGGSNQTTGPTGQGGGPGGVAVYLPGWVVFVAIALVAAAIVAFAVPRVRDHYAWRGGPTPDVSPEEARQALGAAAQQLQSGADPRSVILELYRRLLQRVEPLAGDLEPSTPDEIRKGPLVQLGIRPGPAEGLTRLFEEARYSTHPLGPEAREGAVRAIAEAESDLARIAPLP